MAPDSRAARRAVTVIFLLNGALMGSWAARIPAVKERLDLGEAELGLALGLVALGALTAMPVSGWVSARGGSRRTTRFAFVCFCVALPLPALAPVYALMLPAALLLGAGNGSLDVAMNAHGVAVARRRDRATPPRRRRRAPPRPADPLLLPCRVLLRRAGGGGHERARRERGGRRPLAPA